MSERELRSAIRRICDDLDLRAREAASRHGRKVVYPLMLGATLAVATCDDDPGAAVDYGVEALYGVSTGTTTGTGAGSQTGTPAGTGGEGGDAGAGGHAGGAGGGQAGGAGGAGGSAAGAGGS